MEDFIFNIPTKIFFGRNSLSKLGKLIQNKRVLLSYGGGSIKKSGLYNKITKILDISNCYYRELSGIKPNPRVASVRQGIEICQKNELNFILAVGGGSVIDASKAISRGFHYDGDPWEMIKNAHEVKQAIPLGCVLTLSATGTEMNPNAVISNEKTMEKIPTYSNKQKPAFAILNPELTYGVSKYQTSAGIVDIFSHILEQYFSHVKGCDVQDSLAESLLRVCIKYAPIALSKPKNYDARANLMWSGTLALNGLLCAGKLGDWASHKIEHGVSAISDVTHGVGLAIIIPHWMRYVLDDKTEFKFAQYGRNVWSLMGSDSEIAKEAISKSADFFLSLGMPKTLSSLGIKKQDLKIMANKTMLGGKFIGEFKKLKEKDVFCILEQAL